MYFAPVQSLEGGLSDAESRLLQTRANSSRLPSQTLQLTELSCVAGPVGANEGSLVLLRLLHTQVLAPEPPTRQIVALVKGSLHSFYLSGAENFRLDCLVLLRRVIHVFNQERVAFIENIRRHVFLRHSVLGDLLPFQVWFLLSHDFRQVYLLRLRSQLRKHFKVNKE